MNFSSVNLETIDLIESKNPTREANDGLTPAWDSIRTEGLFPSLVLIPPCFGGSCYFSDLKDMLDPDQPIYIIEPGVDSKAGRYPSVEDITKRMADLVECYLGSSPIRLCGFSFGGNLAWDLAKQLESRGITVEFLILLDSYTESSSEKKSLPDAKDKETNPALITARSSKNDLSKLPSNYQKKLGRFKRPFNRDPRVEDGMRALFKDYQYDTLDLDTYVFCPLDGNAIRRTDDPYLGWNGHVEGDLRVIPTRGTHHNFADKPVGRNLARSVNCILKQ